MIKELIESKPWFSNGKLTKKEVRAILSARRAEDRERKEMIKHAREFEKAKFR